MDKQNYNRILKVDAIDLSDSRRTGRAWFIRWYSNRRLIPEDLKDIYHTILFFPNIARFALQLGVLTDPDRPFIQIFVYFRNSDVKPIPTFKREFPGAQVNKVKRYEMWLSFCIDPSFRFPGTEPLFYGINAGTVIPFNKHFEGIILSSPSALKEERDRKNKEKLDEITERQEQVQKRRILIKEIKDNVSSAKSSIYANGLLTPEQRLSLYRVKSNRELRRESEDCFLKIQQATTARTSFRRNLEGGQIAIEDRKKDPKGLEGVTIEQLKIEKEYMDMCIKEIASCDKEIRDNSEEKEFIDKEIKRRKENDVQSKYGITGRLRKPKDILEMEEETRIKTSIKKYLEEKFGSSSYENLDIPLLRERGSLIKEEISEWQYIIDKCKKGIDFLILTGGRGGENLKKEAKEAREKLILLEEEAKLISKFLFDYPNRNFSDVEENIPRVRRTISIKASVSGRVPASDRSPVSSKSSTSLKTSTPIRRSPISSRSSVSKKVSSKSPISSRKDSNTRSTSPYRKNSGPIILASMDVLNTSFDIDAYMKTLKRGSSADEASDEENNYSEEEKESGSVTKQRFLIISSNKFRSRARHSLRAQSRDSTI